MAKASCSSKSQILYYENAFVWRERKALQKKTVKALFTPIVLYWRFENGPCGTIFVKLKCSGWIGWAGLGLPPFFEAKKSILISALQNMKKETSFCSWRALNNILPWRFHNGVLNSLLALPSKTRMLCLDSISMVA